MDDLTFLNGKSKKGAGKRTRSGTKFPNPPTAFFFVRRWRPMSDEELVRALEAGQMPAEGFPHASHIRAAWWYLSHFRFAIALDRFCAALRAFAAAQGTPDRYHETITVAYMLLINERIDEAAGPTGRGSRRTIPIYCSGTRRRSSGTTRRRPCGRSAPAVCSSCLTWYNFRFRCPRQRAPNSRERFPD